MDKRLIEFGFLTKGVFLYVSGMPVSVVGNRGRGRGGRGGTSTTVGTFGQGTQTYGAIRQDKLQHRYNPIGMGGGYNMYNWN